MPVTESITVVPDDILGIIQRHLNLMHNYVSNPPADFSADNLARYMARTYGFVQKLQDMAKEAAEQGGVVGANGSEAAKN